MGNREDENEGMQPQGIRSWKEGQGSSGRKSPSSKKGSKKVNDEVRRYATTLVVLAVVLIVCVIGFMPLDQKITQGLDIQGGVSVTMTASKPDGSAVSEEDMDTAITIVTNRVNSLGASEATVQRQGSNQILIQIPGATDAQQAIDTIGTTGVLEFVDLNDVADQDALLKIKNGQSGVRLEPGLYTAFMTGDNIQSVSIGMESATSAYYAVDLVLDSYGTAKFAEITKALAPTHGAIAILLDGVVQSAPSVISEIPSGKVAITGRYTLDGAKSFKTVLESGSLPVTLEFSDSSFVGPTLGQDSLMQGLAALLVGFALILVYLFVFYGGLGLVTAGSLFAFGVVYLGLLAFLSRFGEFALSLPGLAGIVLTIGMAADASILVLERFREELRAGKTIRTAATSGSKHGIMTALDAGVVSLISALGLFFLTTGSAKGFGLTLALGVLCSFLTLLCFTTPALRLLARKAIPGNTRFWGVAKDIAEGEQLAVDQGRTVIGKAPAKARANSQEGGDLDA